MTARYDGHADWYDSTFHGYASEHGSAGLLARLLGPPDPADPRCLDVGCGTGLHFAAVQARGHRVIGVDVSADQLRVAAARKACVVRADAARLPFRDGSIPAVVMTYIHTDVDDFAGTIAEAVRVLRPGGKLVYVGVHPAFVGAFIDRRGEAGSVQIVAGYGNERLQRDPTGRFPMRCRVGTRNLTLATFLGAFLAQQRLRLATVTELDTQLRPWANGTQSDGRILPWNIAIVAHTDTGPRRFDLKK